MFKGWLLFLIILGYLSLLFLIAYYAERREKQGKSLVANPFVYSLSIAVYCTSWTFYGSVGEAATSGLSFLPIYLGPTLMASLWWLILYKIIGIAKENRITTISDFIGSRYGNSLFLSALVTIVTLIGITPYLGLQMKAIMNTFTLLAGETRGSVTAGWVITLILGVFAIIFGARRLDASERHGGLVFAIACSGPFPAIFLSIVWKKLTTWGTVWAIIVGSVSAVTCIILSPTVWVDVFKNKEAIFPLRNPAIITMTLAFLTAWIVSSLAPDKEAEAKFEGTLVRTYLGVGAE